MNALAAGREANCDPEGVKVENEHRRANAKKRGVKPGGDRKSEHYTQCEDALADLERKYKERREHRERKEILVIKENEVGQC